MHVKKKQFYSCFTLSNTIMNKSLSFGLCFFAVKKSLTLFTTLDKESLFFQYFKKRFYPVHKH